MAFGDMDFRWRSGRDAKVLGKFLGGIFEADAKQLCGEIDDIAAGPAAEAVEPLIQFQTGVMIFMEGAQCHSMNIHFQSIRFRGLSGCHSFLRFQKFSSYLFFVVIAFCSILR